MTVRWGNQQAPQPDPPASRLPRGWSAEQTLDLLRRLQWRARLQYLHLVAVRRPEPGDLAEFDALLDGVMGLRQALGATR